MMKTPEAGRCLIKKKWPEVLINKTESVEYWTGCV